MSSASSEEITPQPKILKKRGRKNKQELLDILNKTTLAKISVNKDNVPPLNEDVSSSKNTSLSLFKDVSHDDNLPKRARRGRKPNSVKIIDNVNNVNITLNKFYIQPHTFPSVILHLKCRTSDTLESNNYEFCDITNSKQSLADNSYNMEFEQKNNERNNFSASSISVAYSKILSDTQNNTKYDTSHSLIHEIIEPTTVVALKNKLNQLKELNKKIKHLDFILSSNIEMKSSACFWCTETFSNDPVFIPKHKYEDTFHVYGNFCSLECAAAHLLKSSNYQSIIMEQYSLLHSLYLNCQPNSIQCIKPAPEPRYMLDKFLGNLSIDDYRSINNSGRFFILLDKPIYKITPEYHEECANFQIQEKNIPSASS